MTRLKLTVWNVTTGDVVAARTNATQNEYDDLCAQYNDGTPDSPYQVVIDDEREVEA